MTKSIFLALAITIMAIIWIASGIIFPSQSLEQAHTATPITQTEPELMKVQTEIISPQNYTKTIKVNGRSEANKNVTIRAEAEGQITEILAAEGQKITKDTEIVKIDINEKRERVREARELVKQRKIEFDAAKKLSKQGYASVVRVAQTQSAYESARASLTRAEIDLQKTTVLAPFDGILGKRHVDIGDYVRIGDPLTELIDLNPLKIAVFVNEKEVVQLSNGNKASLIFIGGETREGVVSFISPIANEQSRTFRVDITMDNSEKPLPSGITAEVEIHLLSKQAYKIPPSIITLDDAGQIGVKIVTADNKVAFAPITILDDSANAMWISGLSGNPRIITVGQDFVTVGQTVEPIEKQKDQ